MTGTVSLTALPVNGETLTIGNNTYTFRVTITETVATANNSLPVTFQWVSDD